MAGRASANVKPVEDLPSAYAEVGSGTDGSAEVQDAGSQIPTEHQDLTLDPQVISLQLLHPAHTFQPPPSTPTSHRHAVSRSKVWNGEREISYVRGEAEGQEAKRDPRDVAREHRRARGKEKSAGGDVRMRGGGWGNCTCCCCCPGETTCVVM